MKHTIFVLAMSLFLPATVNAADIDGLYSTSYSEGKIGSCGTYVAARDEGRRGKLYEENNHIGWAFGYLTAYNLLTPDTYDIIGQTDLSAILLWLENYCKRNPLARFAEAMVLLTDELHPERIRKAPK
ncbi:MAG: hypothetical protein O7B27_08315 [Gammaproteobacteria bacterium]|nr:hypothetical protein [Gammaproteobacteria bacterium]